MIRCADLLRELAVERIELLLTERQTISLRQRVIVFFVAFLAMLSATVAWTLSRGTELDALPSSWNVDGVFYDNLAFNLNQGDGFVVDLQAQSWRSNYVEANGSASAAGNYNWLMPVQGTGPTALRLPGYPFALAAIYRVFGHRPAVARIFGCVFVSLGVALLLTFCALRWGYLPAVIAATTVALDFSVMQSAGTLASESLAILVLAITFLLVARAWESPTHGSWFVAGMGFASLVLIRGIWSLGLLIMIALLLIGCVLPFVRKRMTRLKLTHFVAFLAVAIVFAMPWWVRNCIVTEHFTPFGTAGSCGFVGAYCDESLADYGQWQADVYNDNQLEVQATVDMDSVNLAHLEYLIGQASLQKTKQWCLENWSRIPELMFFRALSHWGLFNPSVPIIFQAANVWLVVIGLIGCFCCTDRLRLVFVFVLVLDTFLVMLTWEHLGRYAIPIRPVVHIGYGLAIAVVTRAVTNRFATKSNIESRPEA
jgi:hypothetical protein